LCSGALQVIHRPRAPFYEPRKALHEGLGEEEKDEAACDCPGDPVRDPQHIRATSSPHE
jgi:hypothetical protein